MAKPDTIAYTAAAFTATNMHGEGRMFVAGAEVRVISVDAETGTASVVPDEDPDFIGSIDVADLDY